MNSLRASLCVMSAATLLATASPVVAAQAPATQQTARSSASPYFTATDALEINTYAVADMSDDGHWLALTQAVRRDSYGNDYRHDGDPTYVHRELSPGTTRAPLPGSRAEVARALSP